MAGTVGVPLSSLIQPAYRIAGITQVAGVSPNDDKYAEAIGETNRMMGTWQCQRPKIYTVGIYTFSPVAAGQKIFLIGPNAADFPMPFRPEVIREGVIGLLGTNPVVRLDPMHQMDDTEWANVHLQDIPNAIPTSFYYDRSLNSETGCGQIYMVPQAGQSIQVEWYVWNLVTTFFTRDDQVALPPGYEGAIVYNLAKRLAALNPKIASIGREALELAQETLAAIESRNNPSPRISSDAPRGGHRAGFNWFTGLPS